MKIQEIDLKKTKKMMQTCDSKICAKKSLQNLIGDGPGRHLEVFSEGFGGSWSLLGRSWSLLGCDWGFPGGRQGGRTGSRGVRGVFKEGTSQPVREDPPPCKSF